VSLVDWSPSTVIRFKDRSTARRVSVASDSRAITASVAPLAPQNSRRTTTPTRRFTTLVTRDEVTKQTPEKSLVEGKKRTGGRDARGRISSRFIGGGAKQAYRIIDFKRDKTGIPATVVSIEYDPNRSPRIALLAYADGEKRYIIQPEGLKVGQKVVSGPEADEGLAILDEALGAAEQRVFPGSADRAAAEGRAH